MPRYSSFSDVGTVITNYLKSLGNNGRFKPEAPNT